MPNFKFLISFVLIPILGILFLGWLFFQRGPLSSRDEKIEFRYNYEGYAPERPFRLTVLVPRTPDSPNNPLANDSQNSLRLANNHQPTVVLASANHKPFRKLTAVTSTFWNESLVRFDISVPALPPGQYTLLFNGTASPRIDVKPRTTERLSRNTLQFFKFQRCGSEESPFPRCHESNSDFHGGWHDAGDYLRFTLTTSFATTLLLNAAQASPSLALRFQTLDEVHWGLMWLDKMWSHPDRILLQAGDQSDHDTWRLPTKDSEGQTKQPMIRLDGRPAANIAGRLVASFALYAALQKNPQDAQKWKKRAVEIYAWAAPMKKSISTSDGFYKEEEWQDDMALAALELYALTKDKKYLIDAEDLIRAFKNPFTFDYAHLHLLTYYKWGLYQPQSRDEALRGLRALLTPAEAVHQKHPQGLALQNYFWGSHLHLAGMAIGALLNDRLENNERFRPLAEAQWNYFLGQNPWGVNFASREGVSPQHPHHQIDNLSPHKLPVFWVPGPVTKKDWDLHKIQLTRQDKFAKLQSRDAVYHDDKNDYVTNEPTLTMSATGFFLSVLMDDSERATPD